ncbi:MAG: hypothetical protein H6838_05465 [Planctomycetes bacterium]|nr:hypothetical protein [Planctomycetota bacterium]MCB9884919.1 hypothetical protein [Planctomycetota bacterium]
MASGGSWMGVCAGLAVALSGAVAAAQEPAHRPDPDATANHAGQDPAPAAANRAALKRGASDAPTHHPHPELRPADALQHLRNGLDARRAALAKGEPPPAPQERPAGAGRYVAAVITCADADLDAPALFGLARRDLLCISCPGPFVSSETVALLEHLATDERLSLIVVLGHDDCTTRSLRATTPAQQLLSRRLAALRRNARLDQAVTKAFLLGQRDALLGASELLMQRSARDQVRVVPGRVDARGEVLWLGQRVDAMPLQPVK